MYNTLLKTAVFGFFIGAFFCATATAFANDGTAASTKSATSDDGLSSAAHLGFAVVDKSSTGFKKVSGSTVFLDVTKRLSPSFDLGLRTLAQGGQKDGAFYRMGAGPLLNVDINSDWSAQLAYNWFKETAMDSEGTKAYHSRGQSIMLGWERNTEIMTHLDLLWGGFLCVYQGSIETEAAVSPAGKQRYAEVEKNNGMTHGLEMALRMTL